MEISRENEMLKRRAADADAAAAAAGSELEGLRCEWGHSVQSLVACLRMNTKFTPRCRSAMDAAQQPHE